jgi:hypothetical protein
MTTKYKDLPACCKTACKLIKACQKDLGRNLARGECNDLLIDRLGWYRSTVVAVMDSIWAEVSRPVQAGN